MPRPRTQKPPQNLIGPVLTRVRKERKMTLDDMVAVLQVSGMNIGKGVYGNIERQERRVSDMELVAISQALQVPVQVLLGIET